MIEREKELANLRTLLRLGRLDVIHAGDRTLALADRVRAVAMSRLLEDVSEL